MAKLGFKTDGCAGGVKVMKQGFNVDPLLQKQADCISTMTYNEYWQVIDAGYQARATSSSSNTRTRASPPWRTASTCWRKLKDPAFVDKHGEFVKASMKGWDYASSIRTKRSRSCSPTTPPAPRPRSTRSA